MINFNAKKKEVIILGDLNIDLLKSHTNQPASELLDTVMHYNNIPKITLPTRITETTATLIDHIYDNTSDRNSLAGTLLSDITDHHINFIIMDKEKTQPKHPKSITYRPVTESNQKKFNENLEKSTAQPVYYGQSIDFGNLSALVRYIF